MPILQQSIAQLLLLLRVSLDPLRVFVAGERGFNGDSDVQCPESLPGIHFEVKVGYPKMDHGTKLLDAAREQAASECGSKEPVVFWQPPRKCWRMDYRAVAGNRRHWATLDSTESMRLALALLNRASAYEGYK